VAAYGGFYPPIDEGKVRIVMWISSTVLGALLATVALRAPTWRQAVAATFGLAAVFGWVNAFVGGIALMVPELKEPAVLFLFAGVFGVPVGLLYGIPLSLLVAPVHRGVRSASLDGADAAKAWASLWAALAGLAPLGLTHTLGSSLLPAVPGLTLSAVALISLAYHARRLFARRAWMERVRAGKEPLLRVRPAGPEDLADLPRLADGVSVVELLPTAAAVDGVYRSGAAGVPLAIVADAAPPDGS
jgi:hypothetical protein